MAFTYKMIWGVYTYRVKARLFEERVIFAHVYDERVSEEMATWAKIGQQIILDAADLKIVDVDDGRGDPFIIFYILEGSR
jgi:hypothetical protein